MLTLETRDRKLVQAWGPRNAAGLWERGARAGCADYCTPLPKGHPETPSSCALRSGVQRVWPGS
jgi:hypothetical protein